MKRQFQPRTRRGSLSKQDRFVSPRTFSAVDQPVSKGIISNSRKWGDASSREFLTDNCRGEERFEGSSQLDDSPGGEKRTRDVSPGQSLLRISGLPCVETYVKCQFRNVRMVRFQTDVSGGFIPTDSSGTARWYFNS